MKIYFKKIVVSIITWEAKLVLKKYKPKIVAITGSVGKTSTKDGVYSALAPFFHVRKSEKSFNSEMGVPLSILGVPNGWTSPVLWLRNIISGFLLILIPHSYPEWLVLEVGADTPGDIKSIASWLKPDVVVITRFPETPVHIEFFESKEHVIQEKTYLAQAVKSNGLLVLNADDEKVLELKTKLPSIRTVTYGFSSLADVRAKDSVYAYKNEEGYIYPDGREWTLVADNALYPVRMPHIIGMTHIYAVLAGLAIVFDEKKSLSEAVTAVSEYRTPPGRLSLIPGIKQSMIIDDTYNSSPVACEAAIDLLGDLKISGRKIAVLGDMLELGKHTQEEHQKIGSRTVGKTDMLVTVGIRSVEINTGAKDAGFSTSMMRHFNTSIEAMTYVEGLIVPGDVVLVKGSQSVRMERIVKKIIAHPEQAGELLVRQEKEWEKR